MRHSTIPIILATPIPLYPGHIAHIEIPYTNKKVMLTEPDKHSKYTHAKIVKSRAAEVIREPPQDFLASFGIPEKIVGKTTTTNIFTRQPYLLCLMSI